MRSDAPGGPTPPRQMTTPGDAMRQVTAVVTEGVAVRPGVATAST